MSIDSVLRTMQREGLFAVEDSPELAERVHQFARKISKNPRYAHPKRPKPPVGHPGVKLRTSPAEVLRQIGVATSFFRNSPFAEVARHWAQVRYCGTLCANSKDILTLSEEGGDVVYHHKIAQSEYLGIGFAIIVAQASLREEYPGWDFKPVDADVALKFGLPGGGPVKQKETTKRRPDYFLVGHRTDGSGGAKIVVLECKGTHSPSSFAVDQLAKACSQVGSVEVGGKTPQGLMVASCFSSSGIKAHILDPPGESDLWAGSEEEMDALLGEEIEDPPEFIRPQYPTTGEDAGEMAEEIENAEDVLSEEERSMAQEALRERETGQAGPPEVISVPEASRSWFFRVLANTAAASTLLFAGAEGVAERFGVRRSPPGELNIPSEERELSEARRFTLDDDLEFYGTRYVMSLPGGGVLQVDRGVEKTLYDNLTDHRLGVYLRTAHQVKQRWKEIVQQKKGPPREEAVSVGRDGTVLRMRVRRE